MLGRPGDSVSVMTSDTAHLRAPFLAANPRPAKGPVSGVALLFPLRAGDPTHTQARARTRRDKGGERERGAGTDVDLTPLKDCLCKCLELRGGVPPYL